jgi:hypothetical protein
MNLEIFALCDAATESGGKLNLLGAFDTIVAPAAPHVHPACAVVLRLRFKRIEAGRHTVRLDVVDADGHRAGPPFQTEADIRLGDAEDAVANLILNFQQLRLEQFGRYCVDLAIDGRQEGSLPLYLRPIPTPAPQG